MSPFLTNVYQTFFYFLAFVHIDTKVLSMVCLADLDVERVS